MSKEAILNELKTFCDRENIKVIKPELGKIFDFFMSIIREHLDKMGEIRLHGIGTFCVKVSKERLCLNPQTKSTMTVPAKKRVKFKPSRNLSDVLNEKENAEAN